MGVVVGLVVGVVGSVGGDVGSVGAVGAVGTVGAVGGVGLQEALSIDWQVLIAGSKMVVPGQV